MTDEKKPIVRLSNENANAEAIINACTWAAKKANWSDDKITTVKAEMRAGNYEHLLRTVKRHFEVK